MIANRNHSRFLGASLASLKWFSSLVILFSLLIARPSFAQDAGPDEQYLQIYSIIDQADALEKSGKTAEAKTKYQEAQTALLNFKKKNPIWNTKVVGYRLKYVTEKLSPPAEVASAEPAPVTVKSEPKAAPKSVKPVSQPTGPQVKLLEAGAEPRKELRLHPKAGDVQSCVMIMKTSMDMGMGEPIKMPAMNMPMDISVKEVSPNGDISCEIVLGEVTLTDDPNSKPEVAAAMKASLAGVKGMIVSNKMSNRGFIEATSTKLPAGIPPQMRQSMDQMKESMGNLSLALPQEAIGVGGKWEVKQTIKSQGMTINQTTTYEVVSIEGDRVTVKNSLVQSAGNQKIASPMAPQMKMDLIKMEGNATGTFTLDAKRPVPAQATVEYSSETAMGMNVGGKKQEMNMKMEMSMQLESK